MEGGREGVEGKGLVGGRKGREVGQKKMGGKKPKEKIDAIWTEMGKCGSGGGREYPLSAPSVWVTFLVVLTIRLQIPVPVVATCCLPTICLPAGSTLLQRKVNA